VKFVRMKLVERALPNVVSRFSSAALSTRLCAAAFLLATTLAAQMPVRAQTSSAQAAAGTNADPAAALAAALIAACRQDPSEFATHLTAENAAAFRGLPQPQRINLLKRFVLLDDPGKPLLSATAEGHTEVRCEAGGVMSDMRFGATQMHESLAFIPVEVPKAGTTEDDAKQSVRFGLVRESGEWKLLSLGLLLLDIPTLARGWETADRAAPETAAVVNLHRIADALKAYQQAYGKLPETLAQLGPPATPGASPDKAGLLDEELASGEHGGYRFRFSIVSGSAGADESERDKAAGFELAAIPAEYGTGGRKSFYLDSKGILRGADKHGAVADAHDPRIVESQPPDQP
jgi:hypothetical protein